MSDDIENCVPPELASEFSEKRGGTDRRLRHSPYPQAQGARFILGMAASFECLHADRVKDPELRRALQIVLGRYSTRYSEYLESFGVSNGMHESCDELTVRIAKGFLDDSFK